VDKTGGLENHQSSSVIMTTRPKKIDLFAATTRQEKKNLIDVRYAAPTLHLVVD